MARGWEAERLAVYFEEIGAYEYTQLHDKNHNNNSTPSDEKIEFVLEDQPADVWEPDEE